MRYDENMGIKKILWVSWHEHRRTTSITEALGAELVIINLDYRTRIVRYIIGTVKTWRLFKKKQPSSVIVQNPSFMLAFIAVLWKPYFHYTIGVDTHNSGFGLHRKNPVLHWILKYIQTNSDFVIAHNNHIHSLVADESKKVVVIPDPVPIIPEVPPLNLKKQSKILFICSFSKDEPYREVVDAAKMVPGDCHIYITGHYENHIDPEIIPPNVSLLGWVSLEKYNALLKTVDVIMALTNREACLLCGAYEAVAVRCPLITSNTDVLRSHFNKGVVYTGHSPEELAGAINIALRDKHKFIEEIGQLDKALRAHWETHKVQLLDLF